MITSYFKKGERFAGFVQLQRGWGRGGVWWGSLLPKAVEEEVLYCPSQLVSEKQTHARTSRAEVVLLAGFTKGLFGLRLSWFPPPEGDMGSVSGCWW